MRQPTGRRGPLAAWSALLLVVILSPAVASEDPPQPIPAISGYDAALESYRAGRFAEAASILEKSIEAGEATSGHLSLLGWCQVHLERFEDAVRAFRRSLAEDAGSLEARQGLAVALAESGSGREAVELATRLADERPGDEATLAILRRVLGKAGLSTDERLSPAADVPRGSEPEIVARAGPSYLEVRHSGRFLPLFVKGVNLGVALPGRFPAEFPLELSIYREWLDQIAAGGMNVVRTYTLLPPVFYQALREHNEAIRSKPGADRPPPGFLWLIQGVWTELPDDDAYDHPSFAGAFREETERIIDVLHGNILVAHRPGHASGLYRHDVSSMTLGLILGREWEPYSVEAFDAAGGTSSFSGKYFGAAGATAMEAWIAEMMDHAVGYEASRYGVMRPVAFTNWPTLDPLHHPTEATKAEERDLARRHHLEFDPGKVREYDNDGVSVDASRIRATPLAKAGHFASYHAYPYYPDFMNLDPGYSRARDRHGADNYYGYLIDLREHHQGIPVLISEIGVPTSRGIAHVQPQGFNHGGHNETGQGEVDARLMEAIHDAGCAGGIVFAWLDEWFKKNWLVIEFEVPAERKPKWHNALDAEQNYGLMALRAGSPGPAAILDGKAGDWAGRAPLLRGESAGGGPHSAPRLRSLWAAHDEAYFYLRLDVSGSGRDGAIDWEREEILVGIDTYGADKGDRRFPVEERLLAPTGMEFMVRLAGPEASLVLVDPPYDLLTHRYNRPYRSVANEDGRYIEIVAETNRKRVGRDGTLYPAIRHSMSPLRQGTTDPEAPAYDDLADWSADAAAGVIELRLPWGLLNVTDPSSRQVVEDGADITGGVGTATTEGFRIYAALVERRGGRVLDTLPPRDGAGWLNPSIPALYSWPRWEEPTWHSRPKRSYFILRDRLAALPDWIGL